MFVLISTATQGKQRARCAFREEVPVKEFGQLYIDGSWTDPVNGRRIEVINPTTEGVFASVAAGSAEDIDRGVAAAKRAFPAWSNEAPAQRSKLLRRGAPERPAPTREIAQI